MVYQKQTWRDGQAGGTPVSAARLNVIEEGIEAAHEAIESLPETLTPDEISQVISGAINALPEGISPEDVNTAIQSAIEALPAPLSSAEEVGADPAGSAQAAQESAATYTDAQVAEESAARLATFSSLPAVATTGDYLDLANLPSIPSTPGEVNADPAGAASSAQDAAAAYTDSAVSGESTARDLAIASSIADLIGAAPSDLNEWAELVSRIQAGDTARASLMTAINGKQAASDNLTMLAAVASTTLGRTLLTLADSAAGRAALGLGSAATSDVSAFDAAGAAAAAQAFAIQRGNHSGSQSLDTTTDSATRVAIHPTEKSLLQGANSAANPNALARRDNAGYTAFTQVGLAAAAPTEGSHATRKSYVDAQVTTAKDRANHTGKQAISTVTGLDAVTAKSPALIVSTGSSQNTGTFGTPVRYTDSQRRGIRIQNLSAVSIQVGFSAINTLNPPSWGSATTLAPGEEFYDNGNPAPLWFRDSGGTSVTVAYTVELGGL